MSQWNVINLKFYIYTASHLQHLGSFSVSLKNIVYYNPKANSLHLQHSIYKFKHKRKKLI